MMCLREIERCAVMRLKKWATGGVGFIKQLTTYLTRRPTKTPPVKQANLTSFYIGTWTFYDEQQKRHHTFQVSSHLTIKIDGKPLAGKIIKLTAKQLLFLDQYGYELLITADEQQPATIFDEADQRTYPIAHLKKDVTKGI